MFQPLPIKSTDITLFNYRASEILKSITKNALKLYRLIEIQKIMLKSKKMKEYFEQNEKEKKLLLHKLNKLCKKFEKTKVKILSDIPSYLEPSIVKEEEQMSKL